MEAIIILVVIFLFLMIYFNPRLDVVKEYSLAEIRDNINKSL